MSSNNGPMPKTLGQAMFPEKMIRFDVKQKKPGKTVIAHISDLHFRSDTNFDEWPWNALIADLTTTERNNIDVLAVTGDLIDAPFTGLLGRALGRKDEAVEAFSKVDKYLQKLCGAINIEPKKGLVVVPGNHDFRLSGIVKKATQPEKFLQRFAGYCRPILLPSLRLCVFVMDSNTMERSLDLAAGAVEKNYLVDFGRSINEMTSDYADCTRVVLLHHHPMPIAAAENSSLFDDPKFTLLKNAGQFMTNMVRARVNLILHGHQHHAGYSKAIFPYERSKEHMITIIGAGSAGKKIQSYNLITITDGGQIEVERRSLRNNPAAFDYEDARPILVYDDACRIAFDRLAVKANAKLSIKKYTKLYVIESGSGDVDLYERFENVTAFSEDVKEFPTFVESRSGFFAKPQYEKVQPDDQQINWVWSNETYYSQKREARITFTPSLKFNRPISYERRSKAYNLFHFNQRDREDATDNRWRQEYIEFTIQNAIDLLILTACFPEGHYPDNFYRIAHNTKTCPSPTHEFDKCAPDTLEKERFDLHFSKFKDARTFVVSLEKPLPGYIYWIHWNLPPVEEDEIQLSPIDAGRARDFEKKLLQSRSDSSPYNAEVQQWLINLRNNIVKSDTWRGLEGSDDMEISLYSYDSQGSRRGLICVAADLPKSALRTKTWDGVIEPGTTLIGASYRRKEPMLYCSTVVNHKLGESEYIMRIPEQWRTGEAGQAERYTVLCTVPLFYPIPVGRRIAVLTFASKADDSRLLNFAPPKQVGSSEEKIEELAKIRDSLLEDILERHCKNLAELLDVK